VTGRWAADIKNVLPSIQIRSAWESSFSGSPKVEQIPHVFAGRLVVGYPRDLFYKVTRLFY
jgi:hypothetical protein